jgi:hypothetical protein
MGNEEAEEMIFGDITSLADLKEINGFINISSGRLIQNNLWNRDTR